MPSIAMVAALEYEVEPLIRTWKVRWIEHEGRQFKVFENGNAALVCGGIGFEAARRATEAMIRTLKPDRILSVGFAGALDPALGVAAVLQPNTIVDVRDGARIETAQGSGVLASVSQVADPGQKRKLRDLYGASAVDMEAAAVARGAEVRGVQFGAWKVVSDEAGFSLPPVAKFVTSDGRFRTARFALHVALRPWLWRATMALARNSRKASQALSSALVKYLEETATGEPAHAGEK